MITVLRRMFSPWSPWRKGQESLWTMYKNKGKLRRPGLRNPRDTPLNPHQNGKNPTFSPLPPSSAVTTTDQMAGAKPHFAPHAAYAQASASPSASTESDSTVDADADVVVFRLLLPRAFGDEDAIRLYAAAVPLRRHTAALHVRVDALEGYPEDVASRVAVVLGPTSPTRPVEACSSSSGEPLQLSPAQEALVSVVDVGGVLHRVVGRAPEFVACLLLVEAAGLEALGRGTLEAIASETNAELRVMSLDEGATPSAHSAMEVIEITGDRTTIRKAIVALSSYLQGDLHACSLTTSVTTPSPLFPWKSSEVPDPNYGDLHSGVSTKCANVNIPWIDCPQDVAGNVKTENLQQISFRLLCHVNLAGGLIGKKGMIIKGFETETGASIDVGNPFSGCMERVITISALESPDKQSKVQSAILCIFDRMEEVERPLMFRKPECSARVLVPKSQFSCLVGLGGDIIKEMVKSTGARIEILDEIDVPACASNCERVLQITGNLVNVRDALFVVSEKLRNHAFSSKSTKHDYGNATSSDIIESTASMPVNISSTDNYLTDNFPRTDHGPSVNQMESLENSFNAFHLSLANAKDTGITNLKNEVQKPPNRSCAVFTGVQKSADGDEDRISNSNHGITSLEENQLMRVMKDPVVTRMTYEIAACGGILCLLYGDKGNNLAQLRQITGADITVYDPPPETSDCSIVISGTPDQAQLALAALIDLTRQMS